MKYYFSVPVRVELFEQTGLAGPSMASTMIKKVYPHGVTIPVFQRGNPQIQTGLGVELHAMGDPKDKLQLAAIACRGAFMQHSLGIAFPVCWFKAGGHG